MLRFRSSEQEAVKLMRQLLNLIFESVAAEKELLKDLKQMAERLQALDRHPDEKLSSDQANLILGNNILLLVKSFQDVNCVCNGLSV